MSYFCRLHHSDRVACFRGWIYVQLFNWQGDLLLPEQPIPKMDFWWQSQLNADVCNSLVAHMTYCFELATSKAGQSALKRTARSSNYFPTDVLHKLDWINIPLAILLNQFHSSWLNPWPWILIYPRAIFFRGCQKEKIQEEQIIFLLGKCTH